MNRQTVMAAATEFVGQHINATEIDPEIDLFTSGMVNSLFAMQMVLFVEREFNLPVENEDLDYANFRSLHAIVDFVGRKLNLA
jgi:acyl carrier protein